MRPPDLPSRVALFRISSKGVFITQKRQHMKDALTFRISEEFFGPTVNAFGGTTKSRGV